MGAGDEEIRPDVRDVDILVAETVNSIDREQRARFVRFTSIMRGNDFTNRLDRHFHTRARVHPRHREKPRFIAQGAAHIGNYLVLGCLAGRGVERLPTQVGA